MVGVLVTHSENDPDRTSIILMMMKVYLEALKFEMARLQQLCVQFLENCINMRNVLVALQHAADLNVSFVKVRLHRDRERLC